MVVGDSVWDLLAARRAGALGVGLLSGGYGREELERAGAYRVYADPAEMLARIDELGVRRLAATGTTILKVNAYIRDRERAVCGASVSARVPLGTVPGGRG